VSFELRVDRRAAAYLRRLDPPTQRRILHRLDQIAVDPYGQQTKALADAGGRRAARVGDYRIVFAVDDAERVVNVRTIGPRGRVYRDL
jgi:mRNA interferase RelE/StbE